MGSELIIVSQKEAIMTSQLEVITDSTWNKLYMPAGLPTLRIQIQCSLFNRAYSSMTLLFERNSTQQRLSVADFCIAYHLQALACSNQHSLQVPAVAKLQQPITTSKWIQDLWEK